MKYEALKKEIDGMLSLLSGVWSVEVVSLNGFKEWYVAAVGHDRNVVGVSGKGRTKAEALGKLLENWRKGQFEPYAPAAGSVEELRLKMAVRKG